MYGDAIGRAITAFGVFCLILGGVIVGVCVYVIPWLWDLVKPWIHAVTA